MGKNLGQGREPKPHGGPQHHGHIFGLAYILCQLTCKLEQVLGRGLQLSFTPWSECGADCGAGYNDRSAICADADGILVADSACSAYSATGPS